MTPLFTMRIPLPLLPLCIKAVRKASEAAAYAWAVLADLHDDLRVMVEPQTVSDLVKPYHCRKCGNVADPETRCICTKRNPLCFECVAVEGDSCVGCAALNALAERCFECQAPGSLYCTKCAVLNTGRVAS